MNAIYLVQHRLVMNTGNIFNSGIIEEVILQGRLREAKGFKYVKDDKFINGLPEYYLELKTHIPVEQSDMVVITNFERTVQIAFVDFTPGSVIAFR